MKLFRKILDFYKKISSRIKPNIELVALGVLSISVYVVMTRGVNKTVYVYEDNKQKESKSRLLGNPSRDAYRQKRKQLERKIRGINKLQKRMVDSLEKIEKRLLEVESRKANSESLSDLTIKDNPSLDLEQKSQDQSVSFKEKKTEEQKVTFTRSESPFRATKTQVRSEQKARKVRRFSRSRIRPKRKILTFPVSKVKRSEPIVILPAGSYVKGKILTGVEVGSKTLPVLAQLDYAYIAPSNKAIDLKGCFMIMKSQGDLSTEKVELQGKTLSCVNQRDQFFEREINSFVADQKDNSYGVNAKLKSNQGRVAMMAFTSSVVERLSELIKGESRNNIAKTGGVDAGSMVAQWYLKHAMNLSPTLKINSSQDVWVVMTTTTKLPKKYFKGKIYENTHNNIIY